MNCPECTGEGSVICGYCNGLGSRYPEQPNSTVCYFCNGEGLIECDNCWGEKVVTDDDADSAECLSE